MPSRPFSDDGQLPADMAAIRYCDSTMRRSSSFQRAVLARGKVMAPPLFQSFPPGGAGGLGFCEGGRVDGNGVAEKAHTKVMTLVAARRNRAALLTSQPGWPGRDSSQPKPDPGVRIGAALRHPSAA